MRRTLFLILIIALIISGLNASLLTQNIAVERNGHEGFMNYPHNNQRVTIQRNTDFQTTLKILEGLSLQNERRNIINISSFSGGIPVQINDLFWKDALELLVVQLGLVLEERPGVYLISDVVIEEEEEDEFDVDDRMIRITATFFYADRNFMNGMGIDWRTLVDGEVAAEIDFHSAGDVPGVLQVTGARQLTNGSTIFNLEALFRFMETHQKGEMLARPQIIVLNSRPGNIQIGQDFSVRMADDAGNTINEFFSTGIILDVTPTIITADGIEVVHIQASVEKSDAVPGAVTTIINKNSTQTDVLLFCGEETVIGGLFDIEYVTFVTTVPILGRIPLLGRWLFSSRSTREVQREMIVILKAEILAPARDRLHERERLRERFERMRQDFDDTKYEVFGAERH